MYCLIIIVLLLANGAISAVEYTLVSAAETPNNVVVPALKLLIKQGKWKEFNERVHELKKPGLQHGNAYPFSACEDLGFVITMHECAITVARDLCNPAIKQLVDDLENELQAMKKKEEPEVATTDPSAAPSVDQIMARFRGRVDDFSKLRWAKEKEWQQAGLFDDNRKRALDIIGEKRSFSGKCLPMITVTMARFCNQSEDERVVYIASQLSGIAQARTLLKEIEKSDRKKIHL